MSSGHIYTVAGSKGGVGKTTTSINLGACFADAGHSSVIVEADLPMANIIDFVDIDTDEGDTDTLHDVLAGEIDIREAVYEVLENLAVVPSATDPTRYGSINIDRLEPAINRLWWHYDVILIDTPAGMGDEVIKSIDVADKVILVSTPRVSSVRNTRNLKTVIERIGTDIRGLVLTKSGTGRSPGAERIADFLNLDLLGHVPEDEVVPHSQDQRQPVINYAPNSGPAIAYSKIASQLVEDADVRADETPQSERTSVPTPTDGGETAADEVSDADRGAGDADGDRSETDESQQSKRTRAITPVESGETATDAGSDADRGAGRADEDRSEQDASSDANEQRSTTRKRGGSSETADSAEAPEPQTGDREAASGDTHGSESDTSSSDEATSTTEQAASDDADSDQADDEQNETEESLVSRVRSVIGL